MDVERFEIRLCGSGGQGIILASIILAEAVGIFEGYNVSQTQSYGPEARGGRCKAEVVISSTQIDYPKAIQLDMMLALNQASCDAYYFDFKPNGLLLVDTGLVDQVPTSRAVSLPFTEIAREIAGKDFVANMVALGALGHFCPLVSHKSIMSALATRVPRETLKINSKALQAGIEAAEKFDLNSLPRSIIPEEEEEV
ncbi:MAG: 2-oxoacid:acceptor oxidoreductase family protein [Deltaproteobacteria bacterium]|jgi:2-oxoglutarate ferredoxin oxidoreductase subunit gamma|nr:2-oxoacid:acceptor oxidoreductase family protein [Deltaproteobacteria bacterium]